MEMLRMPRSQSNAPAIAEVPAGAPAMEIAHVLFMDIVGFSQLRMQQQAQIQVKLQNLVQATAEVQQARRDDKLIVRPTGDGMALLFLRDMLSPVRCALQLQTLILAQDAQIRQRIGVPIRLRMGIHSGSVLMVEDMNSQSDVAGDGIITAQRVMDCGDTGHILLSSEVAQKLLGMDPWPRFLTDLGEVRVKHGKKVHLFNLVARLDGPTCGNPALPEKVKAEREAIAEEQKRVRGTFFERHPEARKWITVTAVLALLGGGGYTAWTRVPQVPEFVKGIPVKAQELVAGMNKSDGKEKTADDKKNGDKGKPSNNGDKKKPSNNGDSRMAAAESGPRKVLVPDVTNQTMTTASSMLRNANLKIKKNSVEYNPDYGRDLIIRQYPAAGEMVNVNTVIKVAVSKGEKLTPDMYRPEEDVAPIDPPTKDPAPEDNSSEILGEGEVLSEGGDAAADENSPRRPGQRIRQFLKNRKERGQEE
ncbi:MAG: hypothetical protein OHK0029_00090 [Armatimonadaceae bacterium]